MYFSLSVLTHTHTLTHTTQIKSKWTKVDHGCLQRIFSLGKINYFPFVRFRAEWSLTPGIQVLNFTKHVQSHYYTQSYVRWTRQALFFQLYKWGNRVSFLSLQRPWLKLRSIDTHPNVFSFKQINKKYFYIYGVNKMDREYFSKVYRMKLALFRFGVRTIIQKSGDE